MSCRLAPSVFCPLPLESTRGPGQTLLAYSGNSVSSGGVNSRDGGTAPVTISSSTLSGNSANVYGGGIYSTGTVTSQGTILAGNTTSASGPDCSGKSTSAGHNLLGNNSGCTFTPNEGNQVGTADDPIDPLLGPLQDNGGPTWTQALLTGSPAIDTGTPTDCPATDQRCYARPVDGDGIPECDIGAYEYLAEP